MFELLFSYNFYHNEYYNLELLLKTTPNNFRNTKKIKDHWIDDWKNISNFKLKSYDFNNININSIVKIGNQHERFWINVTHKTTTYIYGTIMNELVTLNCPYNYGNKVKIEIFNVLDIFDQNKPLTNKQKYYLENNIDIYKWMRGKRII